MTYTLLQHSFKMDASLIWPSLLLNSSKGKHEVCMIKHVWKDSRSEFVEIYILCLSNNAI